MAGGGGGGSGGRVSLYAVLGVASDCSDAELRSAYRKLAMVRGSVPRGRGGRAGVRRNRGTGGRPAMKSGPGLITCHLELGSTRRASYRVPLAQGRGRSC